MNKKHNSLFILFSIYNLNSKKYLHFEDAVLKYVNYNFRSCTNTCFYLLDEK